MAVAKKVETVAIRMPVRTKVKIRIVGDTPLLVHAWDEKNKRMMLEEQQKKKGTKKAGKDIKDAGKKLEKSLRMPEKK